MNIFEYAMQMEKDGENYYRELAQKTNNKGIKTILTMLADEEVKHYNAVKQMMTTNPQMAETTILTDAKNVFEQMKKCQEAFNIDVGQIQLYKKAQDIEEKSRDFYLEKANRVEKEYQNEIITPELWPDGNYKNLVLCWGSTYNVVREALVELERDDTSLLHYKQVYPLHADTADYLKKADKTIIIESNATSQLGKLIKLYIGVDIDEKILKYNGLSFAVEEIVQSLRKILD